MILFVNKLAEIDGRINFSSIGNVERLTSLIVDEWPFWFECKLVLTVEFIFVLRCRGVDVVVRVRDRLGAKGFVWEVS